MVENNGEMKHNCFKALNGFGFQNVAIGHINRVAVLTGFPIKKL